jgi:hypothetical protein
MAELRGEIDEEGEMNEFSHYRLSKELLLAYKD